VFCLRQNGFGSYFLSKRREEFSSGILIFVIILMNFGYFFFFENFFSVYFLVSSMLRTGPRWIKGILKTHKTVGVFSSMDETLFLRCNKKEIDFIKEHLKSLLYIYRNSV